MYATSGNSWCFDYGYRNHMTSNSIVFLFKDSTPHIYSIKTADVSQLHVTHIGPVFTSNLSLSYTFHVPQLIINLISIGQLCDLGLTVVLLSSSCHVQYPRTK